MCLNKSYTQVLYDCQLLRNSIRDTVNDEDLPERLLSIYFYGLELEVFLSVHPNYIYVLEDNLRALVLCLDRNNPDMDLV
jgi:hypothetical protein